MDHLQANHPAGGVVAEAGNLTGAVHQNIDEVESEVDGDVLARLRAAGLA